MWPTREKVNVRLRQPHDRQQSVLSCPAKRIILKCGRRAGKTSLAAIAAIQRFIQGHRVLYCVPQESQAEFFWREICSALAPAVQEGMFKKNESDRFIELAGTNQRISCKTTWDPDSLRSDFADYLILDEFQLQSERVFGEVAMPLLLDNDGSALLIMTPPSLHAREVSRARDPQHAAKLYTFAEKDTSGRWAAFTWSSHENPFLSKQALAAISTEMTALSYRQEILAEIITEIPGALWTADLIERTRVKAAPELTRVVVGVDPSGGGKDVAGIVVCGVARNGEGYVLKDTSLRGSPQTWGSAAVRAYHSFSADRLVAEENFGGQMVELVVRGVDPNVSYRAVHASRGKIIRAEPVAAQYERGRVHHVGMLPELEEELTSYAGGGPSPGRFDAMTWALTDLLLGNTSLGVVEYLKSDQAQRQVATLEAQANPSLSTRVAGIMQRNEQTTPAREGCSCGAGPELMRIVAGGARRCGQCGLQSQSTNLATFAVRGPGGLSNLVRR